MTNFLVTAPTQADLDLLPATLQAWKIKKQKLTNKDSISTTMRRTDLMQSGPEDDVSSAKTLSFQHVGQRIERLSCGGSKPATRN